MNMLDQPDNNALCRLKTTESQIMMWRPEPSRGMRALAFQCQAAVPLTPRIPGVPSTDPKGINAGQPCGSRESSSGRQASSRFRRSFKAAQQWPITCSLGEQELNHPPLMTVMEDERSPTAWDSLLPQGLHSHSLSDSSCESVNRITFLAASDLQLLAINRFVLLLQPG